MDEYIGFIAATLTTIAFIPQAIKTIRTKETKGISLPMYLIFWIGVLCWLYYGIVLGQTPIIIGNIITAIFAGIVLYFKLTNILKGKEKG
jgi:MtN3 and saliva related transmembrane protein